jgi:nitric oxide dioxygenase
LESLANLVAHFAMSPAQVELVKSSFRRVVPIADQAAVLFYARLFELNPDLRKLFRGEMSAQGKKLMSMIAITVGMLHRFELMMPQLQDLGARHAKYGVQEEHYGPVGEAWLWTLEKALGVEFTPAVREAWTVAFSLVAHTMIEAARTAQHAAPTPVPAVVAA